MKGEGMLTLYTANAGATRQLGVRLGQLLETGDWVCLSGELGAGKTTMVQGIAAGLGFDGQVSSPTFTILHVYPGRVPIYHLDGYRLTGEEAGELGLDADWAGPGVTLVEWPEQVQAMLPLAYLQVQIEYMGDIGRTIRVYAVGGGYHHVIEGLSRSC